MTPSFLSEILDPNRHPVLPYTFRNIRCRTNRFIDSFFPNSIKLWNNIYSDFNELPTLQSLKKHLLCLLRPTRKSTFGIHDPIGLRLLFQLRLGLSPLRSHKKNHNFSDTPSDLCPCGLESETTNHFFNVCPLFVNARIPLEISIRAIFERNNVNSPIVLTDNYLYGHHSLNNSENCKILLATITYLKETNRFSNL